MSQRHTIQKDQVYTALVELGNHPTADQVFNLVHERSPSISRATVYRVLRQMTENGQVYRVEMMNGADCFDHNTVPHSHAVCHVCHHVFDLPYVQPMITQFQTLEKSDFLVTGYSLMFEGVCTKCRKETEGIGKRGQ